MTRTGIYGIYIYISQMGPYLILFFLCILINQEFHFGGWHPQNIPRKKTSHFMTSLVVSSPWFATNLIILLNFSTFPTNKSDFKISLAPPHLAGANAWPRHCLSGIGPRSFWSEQRSLTIIDFFCLFLNTPVKIKGYCIFPLKWVFEIFSHPYPPSKKPMVFRDVTVMAGFSVVSMLGRVMNLDSERRCHWAMNICFTRQCFTAVTKTSPVLDGQMENQSKAFEIMRPIQIAMICMYIYI